MKRREPRTKGAVFELANIFFSLTFDLLLHIYEKLADLSTTLSRNPEKVKTVRKRRCSNEHKY